jgi:hypothetical protein
MAGYHLVFLWEGNCCHVYNHADAGLLVSAPEPLKIFSGPHMKGVTMSICTLTRAANYIETLSICPVDVLPGA